MRASVSLIMVLFLLFLTACNSNSAITTIKDGNYILEKTDSEAAISPQVTISGNDISFSYDPLNSYLPVGVYTIEEKMLTMMTHDGLYKYVFNIDGDKLVFQKNISSEVNLTDYRLGISIADKAEFKLKEN
ncbi:hypothetical protein [Desulfuribacillus alkaliarsenatis]|uniref:Lipoprotein n=1 Tax=Desulfuribacillus alkaliarsenatis TaxID=766136 RepID=A0A1E5G0I8_9FIRM|nr:hypothetical protein [Desulfuribacillus alkaliarsenatis]OEF96357.1 hypothetical protein BHF68_09410 [Desulfuribacillus alkaliarsenatis]